LLSAIYIRGTDDEFSVTFLDGPRNGVQTDYGEDDTGFMLMVWEKGGGFYIGAHRTLIPAVLNYADHRRWCEPADADGKIKLKTIVPFSNFTKTGIKFQNGSELPADVVVLATGENYPML